MVKAGYAAQCRSKVLSAKGLLIYRGNVATQAGLHHLALTPPDSLVLVFHGTVAVIPNSALPIAAKDIIEKINHWCAAQRKELLSLS
ncbi:hypothetical protein ACSV5S_03970 [Agrobacterium deltaense]|uniref:hypothetical protein n=1 Tax=Agrobacterium deltaense TaxID=1183412 RepID=UPI003FD5173F